ncbi:MAG TPA: hypothetical protein VK663_09695 [Burkholderiales bacterium]|nr:hypothetical protein [Burkholderiales bacterium]
MNSIKIGIKILSEVLRWAWVVLYFKFSAITVIFMCWMPIAMVYAVATRGWITLPEAYASAAELPIFAQVAIGVSIVVIGVPALIVAAVAAPTFIERCVLSAVTAIAVHFAPICRDLGAPFRQETWRFLAGK